MEIYPVHLRKLRSEQTKGSILEMESENSKKTSMFYLMIL